MKNIYKLLPLLAMGMILCFPTYSNGQKRKKTKTISTNKKKQASTNNTPNKPVVSKVSQYTWTTYAVKDCGFSVEFPGSEEEIKHIVPNNQFDVFMVQKTFSDGKYFATGVNCVPKNASSSSEGLFPGSSDLDYLFSFVKSRGLIGYEINHRGRHGVETSYMTKNGDYTYEKSFVITGKRKTIQVVVICSNDSICKDNDSTVARFLSSLNWIQ